MSVKPPWGAHCSTVKINREQKGREAILYWKLSMRCRQCEMSHSMVFVCTTLTDRWRLVGEVNAHHQC